jgi:hypothetical protein
MNNILQKTTETGFHGNVEFPLENKENVVPRKYHNKRITMRSFSTYEFGLRLHMRLGFDNTD